MAKLLVFLKYLLYTVLYFFIYYAVWNVFGIEIVIILAASQVAAKLVLFTEAVVEIEEVPVDDK